MKNDLLSNKLFGSIKAYTETEYKIMEKFGELEKVYDKYSQKKTVNFNIEGYIIGEIDVWLKDNSCTSKTLLIRDENCNLIEKSNFDLRDGEILSKSIFKYDERGNRIESNYYYSDKSMDCKSTTKYDENGQVIETDECKPNGSLIEKTKIKYNVNEGLIEYYKYKFDGSLITKMIIKNDEKGNKIEQNIFDPNNLLINSFTFKYEFDSIGNWIKKTCINKDNPPRYTEREFEYYE